MPCSKNLVSAESPKIYRVGTLAYTAPALLVLMALLLWGDFCFHLMETIIPAVLPIVLRQLEAPNWLIGLFLITIPNILNATVCPIVSFWSDRHRGKRGRRIPFILYSTPFLCLFLLLLGFAPSIASHLSGGGWIKNEAQAALVLMGVFIACFQLFNMFVASVYYYLVNDVVPTRFLGRFLAGFRFVGVLASGAFYFWLFPLAETHASHIFFGVTLLYGVVFTLMCLRVKEGEYPPPPEDSSQNTVLGGVKRFFRESFSDPFHWLLYLAVAFWNMAMAGGVFLIFFATEAGLTLKQFGQYTGTAAMISAGLLLPCGILSDRFHPIRTMLFAVCGAAVVSLLPLVFLIFPGDPKNAFAVWCAVFGVGIPFTALYLASELPAFMQLLPRDRFGQFASAAALVRSGAVLVAGLLCGGLFDAIRSAGFTAGAVYRYLPIWYVFFQSLSVGCLFLLYRSWSRRPVVEASSTPLADVQVSL